MQHKVASRRERFRSFMEKSGLTVADISKASGVPATTIYSFLDGKTAGFSSRTEKKIADSFGITTIDIYQEIQLVSVPIIASVVANAQLHIVHGGVSLTSVTGPTGLSGDGLEAYVVDTDQTPPFRPGHKVFTHKKKLLSPDKLIGEICIVELETGSAYLKIIRPSRAKGCFDLEDLYPGKPFMKNVKVAWAKKVVLASFEK